MTPVAHFSLALFVFMGCYFNFVASDYQKYVPLISDVQEYYKPSSVFFIFSRSNRRMIEYTMVHLLSSTFSQKGVVTLVTEFLNLDVRLSSYRKRIGRPLVVVLLKSVSDIEAFTRSTRINKSYPIWLVIFYGDDGEPFCEYCTQPVGNMFRLRFDTIMLVLCCGSSTLQEWWSVHENQTETDDFATWTKNDRLALTSIDGLNARRHDVNGTGLRVVVVTNSSFFHDYGYRMGGFLGVILGELQLAMNFTISEIIRVESFGGYNSKKKSWSGAVGVLARGEADLGIGCLTITSARLDVIDFTYPLLLSRIHLFIKEPEGSAGVQWTAHFEAFTLEIWMIIIILVLTSPLLLAVIKVRSSTISLLTLGIDNYLYVWGIFCQQGLFEFPTDTPLRIAYFSIFISALVVSAAYSASLISFLTLSSPGLPFSTVPGFANDGSYKLIVYQNSSDYDYFYNSHDPVTVKMMSLMKPWHDLPSNTQEGWEQVCNEKVALYTTVVERVTMDIKCKVVAIDTGRVDSLAMALPIGSQYTDVVNYHIERFKGNGIFSRLKRVYYTREEPTYTSHSVVEFSGVAPILTLLAGGIVFAFVVLFCEKIYYSLRNHGVFWPRRVKSGRPKLHGWFSSSRAERPALKTSGNRKFDRSIIGYYP